MLKTLKQFLHRISLMFHEIGVAEWHQEGNTIHLKVQKIGFNHNYCGIPFYCDIEIDPESVDYSGK